MSLLISVIIPVYNTEKYLSRCLDSVIKQTYTKLEIILINDGSTDSSGDICDNYAQQDSRIKVVHKKNAGVSAARNSGLMYANGDYISFIDSDDRIEHNMYEILTSHLKDCQADIVRFNAYRGKHIMNRIPFDGLYENQKLKTEILHTMIGADKFGGTFIQGVLWMHLFKRVVIEDNNIRFSPDLRQNEDRLFTITTISHSKSVLFVNDVLYHYELNGDSLTQSYKEGRWEQELIYLDMLKQNVIEPLSRADNKMDLTPRLQNDYLLRAIVSIHYEFFTGHSNPFNFKKKRIAHIIKDKNVRISSRNIRKNKISLKENILLFFIKYRCSLFLSIFEELTYIKGKRT
ncbi:glycosyltransferase [Dysgonomonas sp. 216]|uniref:glycosyltransferase n=1 Tax=Dysgonomonas sp. 216 TaxID=2302934 RepID=UPI0013D7F82D|nr:glycosyltransferase [Dysgonomonas sp. 216]NDW19004.1 glycosyltransferase [Dysgonomonas sp. 216]